MGLGATPEHEQRETRRPRGVRHARELTLARVGGFDNPVYVAEEMAKWQPRETKPA